MLAKIKALLGAGPETTALIVSPDPPPRSGIISVQPTKKAPKEKRKVVFTSKHVGGKGANLLRLRAAGLNVPRFLLVPASEWDDVLQKAREKSGASIERWISGESPEDGAKLAKAIDEIEISEEVLALVRTFVGSDDKKSYAVRSSATVEDGSDSAYAGQFETVLNVHGVNNVRDAIRTCWKSLLTESVRSYYVKMFEKRPRMAVVVQEQIDCARAGVYFQANPVSGATSTHIVNAAYGQGEGVVAGTVPSDEFWLAANTGVCFKRVIATKSEKIGLSEAKDGTRRDAVESDEQNAPVLSDAQLKQLYDESKRVKAAFLSPQDVEFGFNKDGELFIFQSRPITTRLESLKFEAPEIGLWRLNAHVSVPMSALYEPIWMDGWSKGVLFNSKLVGSGFSACDTAAINGFGYFCLRMPGPKAPPTAPPPKMLMRTILSLTGGKDTKAARTFWEKKVYLTFADSFEKQLKPDWIARHHKMQEAGEKVKTVAEAVSHLRAAHEHFKSAWYCHCVYTLYQMLPSAYFVQCASEWAKCEEGEAWAAIEGFSPVTRGVTGEFPAQIKTLAGDATAMALLQDPAKDAQTALASLVQLPGEVGAAAAKIVNDMQYRLMGGYDPANAIIKENPSFLVSVLRRACEDPSSGESETTDAERAAEAILKNTPDSKREELKTLLNEVRSIMRLRDERALYTDLWGAGILHDAVVRCALLIDSNNVANVSESGERLKALVLEGTFEEIVQATEKGVTPELIHVWSQRKKHRETASIRDAPLLLGGVDIEVTPEHFPNQWLARSFSTMMAATRAISTPADFESQYKDIDGFLKESQKVVFGLPASKGVVEGVARVIKTEQDVGNVQKGDIVVTESPSSLINLILPLASAIVCDFGATLSHAAVCARELGIPCVVGSKIATRTFKDGERVRVDGAAGRVELVA